MSEFLTLTDFYKLAKTDKRIACFKKIPLNLFFKNCNIPFQYFSAGDLYEHLSNFYEGVFLEDLQKKKEKIIICLESIEKLKINSSVDNPLEEIRALQKKYKFNSQKEVLPLITGSIGFIAYDAVRFFEEIPDQHEDELNLPLIFCEFFKTNISIDYQENTLLISTIVDIEKNNIHIKKIYQNGQNKLKEIENLLTDISMNLATQTIKPIKNTVTRSTNSKQNNLLDFTETDIDISDDDYLLMIKKAREYIIAGDAFQVVLSRSYKRKILNKPLDIYKTLRRVSPAPFMFYIPVDSSFILGASPERFINVKDRTISANPIAGTRKRNADTFNAINEKDLLTDKKELAEHMMLVDLTRNDVGSVSLPGSVNVPELLGVHHFSHVTHLISTIKGKLQNNLDPLDALIASFPVGTLSGAPKISAMQIIDKLEQSKRGLYGGCVFRMDGLYDIDSSVLIRMMILQNGVATIRTGAGIVFDSDPLKELQETNQKARPLLETLEIVEGELNVTNN